jgi:hypothetical protein
MSRKTNLYRGRGGQMAVMAEFLMRGYNVAIPEVDIGDDILVVTDSSGEYAKVQVKTALAVKTREGYSTRYTLKFTQLRTPSSPETWYVFANRLDGQWISFVPIARQQLYDFHRLHNVGSLSQNSTLGLYFSYTNDSITCSGQNLSNYLNNWRDWPELAH